jgi:hypothetical protein
MEKFWRKGVLAILMCLCLAGIVLPFSANSMVLPMDHAELVGRSDLVVFGVVGSMRSQGQRQLAEVLIKCVLKGEESGIEAIDVAFRAGLEDSPAFSLNEEVLLFLREAELGAFEVVGGLQGKYTF